MAGYNLRLLGAFPAHAAAVSILGGQMAPEHGTVGLSKSRANGRSTGCSLGAMKRCPLLAGWLLTTSSRRQSPPPPSFSPPPVSTTIPHAARTPQLTIMPQPRFAEAAPVFQCVFPFLPTGLINRCATGTPRLDTGPTRPIRLWRVLCGPFQPGDALVQLIRRLATPVLRPNIRS